jgi:diketogulonate reductase-like aldo/keto reductase
LRGRQGLEQRAFGYTSRKVAVVGQGTWCIEQDARQGVVAALRRGLDLGLTHIDTAELYGSGDAENITAEAIGGRRNDVYLVSKVLPENASRKGTIAACEKSLKRLQTDRLDCYLLHWRGRHPLAETIAAFEELQQAGKILSWGVSNFDTADLDEALAIAGPKRIACNQVLYHIGERAIEHAVIPWCQKHDVAVVAYSPFGQGSFPAPSSPGGRVLAEIGAAQGATARQVALRYLLRHAGMFVIPKAGKLAHVEDNAGAGDLLLTTQDVARISAAFPLPARRRGLPTL